jgi:exodeoxyribonuclease VII large subunit
MSPADDPFKRDILTVSQLTERLKQTLESVFGQVWLNGEISNLRRPASGHLYFTLKDDAAQVRGVMFRGKQQYLGFKPEDGAEVLVRGRVTVYEPRGDYQVVIDYMEPMGEGALRLAFEQLKAKLTAEGLFDPARKKTLPFLPTAAAVVTSPTGAAIRDFIQVARRRFENVGFFVYPVRVQGAGAALEIAEAIEDLNRWGGFDVIVVARGGGSLEDLWAFNEEVVARAVASSEIPIVSAVGHEVDVTICDLAADLRAPTPSAAAELIFRDKAELAAYIDAAVRRLAGGVKSGLQLTRERLAHCQTRLGDPERLLAARRQRLDDLTETLIFLTNKKINDNQRRLSAGQARLAPHNPRVRLSADRQRLMDLAKRIKRAGPADLKEKRNMAARLAERLEAVSPLAVLSRGYALVRKAPDMRVVSDTAEVDVGDRLDVRLSRGELAAVVDEVIK